MADMSWALKYGCSGAGGSKLGHVLNGMSIRAVPCCAKACHAKSCCATLSADKLMSPMPVAQLGRRSRPSRGIHTELTVLVEAWRHQKEARWLCLQAEEKRVHQRLLRTLWGSLGSTMACRYRFAGLCVKGFTTFSINTINRFCGSSSSLRTKGCFIIIKLGLELLCDWVSGFLLQARAFKSSLNVNVTFKTTVVRALISRAGHFLQLK